ncbi:oral cancer-overexpressed protein 1 homolog [Acanthaster planci]|uniref:Oral cancer-overexpressed protein 1 homolog n=1 Tax=Acanthaster planci TaxID=133434 RepID=A0A8B7XEG2_ACAPL|nr:oral cancer-overexpressed protein 1 homolog [Acanthaster planci]
MFIMPSSLTLLDGDLYFDCFLSSNKGEMAEFTPNEDIFDDVVMAEERFQEEGYREGFAAGKRAGEQEGFKMGQIKGREIGSEYGFYLGFVAMWLWLVKEDAGLARAKTVKALETLHAMLASFKVEDVTSESYWDDFRQIRDKFKQVVSLLGIKLDFTEERSQKPPISF